MNSFLASLIAAASVAAPHSVAPNKATDKPIQLAEITCFKTGEEAMPGQMTKICYYDCLGSRVAITISNIQLCPLSIKR